jgi:hypothetical protein
MKNQKSKFNLKNKKQLLFISILTVTTISAIAFAALNTNTIESDAYYKRIKRQQTNGNTLAQISSQIAKPTPVVNTSPTLVAPTTVSTLESQPQVTAPNSTVNIVKNMDKSIDTLPSSSRTPLIINGSNVPEIRGIEHYQQVFGGFVTDTSMVFSQIPDNKAQGNSLGMEMSSRLKEFKRVGLTPLMISEATMTNSNIGSADFFAGVDDFFRTMKQQGVTDNMLGTWVAFPEANMPMDYTRVEAADYASLTNRYVQILRTYFPNARTGVLLDSKTYDRGDSEYITGQTVSLRPYLQGITKGSINTYIMQGFPWLNPNGGFDHTDPANIFPANQAIEAADILGTKELWFNTGIQSATRSGRTYSPTQQQAFLTNMANHLNTIKQRGYSVLVNQFAENKITTEGNNWNLINTGNATEKQQRLNVQKGFISQLEQNGMKFSLLDKF